jgi:hypothetical protein
VIVCLLREFGFCELFLLVVDVSAALGVDTGVVVADHREVEVQASNWYLEVFWELLLCVGLKDAGLRK